ncbi:hypothetical protein SAMN05216232_0434 [Virgibacillus subterraneus]|uniref:Regulatory protein YycH domain-containing protein n=1 Tax=Virgibacillus subterraneus TaxID=621109 RepID=A0A1H8ZGS7_9BACI|nr:hypothetical protein [Virgibacillus subterraneus]SEP63709.1 hypothetical protein SAMN05216232_0434 [Virgibacillus subterraneus]
MTIASEQLGLTGGDKPNEQDYSDYSVLLEESTEQYLTFTPAKVKVGDTFGQMEVTEIQRQDDQTIVSFKESNKPFMVTGVLYNDDRFSFIPDKKTLLNIPVAAKDIGKNLEFHFQNNKKVKKIFGMDLENSTLISIEDLSVNVDQIRYIFSENGSLIKLGMRNAVSSEPELDYPKEKYNTSIELSDKLLNVYSKYAETFDDNFLKGLKPIDIFKLYYHSKNEGNNNVQYALYIKGENQGTPDKETYFNDPFFAIDQTMKQNDKEFYQKLKEVKIFEEVYLSGQQAIIRFELEDSNFQMATFRLIKSTDLGVWKVGWRYWFNFPIPFSIDLLINSNFSFNIFEYDSTCCSVDSRGSSVDFA